MTRPTASYKPDWAHQGLQLETYNRSLQAISNWSVTQLVTLLKKAQINGANFYNGTLRVPLDDLPLISNCSLLSQEVA